MQLDTVGVSFLLVAKYGIKRAWALHASVLLAVPTPFQCRRPAFPLENISLPFRHVCAVPFAAVRCARLPLGAHHHIGAAAKHALAWTAAVFSAETLAFRGGGAACHGARLLLSASVFDAKRRCRGCVGGASCKLARSTRPMFGADTACSYTRGAAFLLAHFPAATAVLAAPASGFDGSGAFVERAGP